MLSTQESGCNSRCGCHFKFKHFLAALTTSGAKRGHGPDSRSDPVRGSGACYPLRRSNCGQSMQAQASPVRERSLTETAAVVTAMQGVVKRTAVQVPGNGEHQLPESNGWCRPHNQTSLRTVHGQGWRQSPSLADEGPACRSRGSGCASRRCLEDPSSSRQAKDRWCVAFRFSKGSDNHWTCTSSQVARKSADLESVKRKDASGVMVTNSSILQPNGNGGARLAASQTVLV